MAAFLINEELLGAIASDANKSIRRRKSYNLHEDYSEPCQRLLNYINIDSYIRPHRHLNDPKDELLVALKGAFGLITFSECGEINSLERFASEAHFNANNRHCFGVEVPAGVWHTVVALEHDSVILEVKAGPFDESKAKEYASWAPEESTEDGMQYLKHMQEKF